MEVLHITNSYGGTKVYNSLYTELDKLGVRQHVFVPLNVNNRKRMNNQLIDFATAGSQINYYAGLGKIHRLLFLGKTRKSFRYAEQLYKNRIGKIDIIHASTMCTDGAVAYRLWQKYNIPYIVAVRNTDINSHYKKLIHCRRLFHDILLNARAVIFISPKYKERLLNDILPTDISRRIAPKALCMPNGLDNCFINNRNLKNGTGSPVKILYAGGINKGKNIPALVGAVDYIRNNHNIETTLTVIGKGLALRSASKTEDAAVEALAQKHAGWFDFLPSIPLDELQKTMKQYDIFAMPSLAETFGLVYVEALSQGLPVIYTKGEGFDGYYEDGVVGFSVDPTSVTDIGDKIVQIIKSYTDIAKNIASIDISVFDWKNIARKYYELYTEIISPAH